LKEIAGKIDEDDNLRNYPEILFISNTLIYFVEFFHVAVMDFDFLQNRSSFRLIVKIKVFFKFRKIIKS